MSALLNVNVDSTSGRAEVLAFKEFVQKNLSSIKFDIKTDNLPTLKMQVDEAALNSGITAVLEQVHKIGIDTGSITKNVQEAIRAAFAPEYQVRIASGHLTEQVRAAVQAGMQIGELNSLPRTNTGTLQGGGVTAAALAEAVRTAVLPLADKIDSMTKSTENSMRQGRRTGSVSVSGRADGASVSVKTSLPPDEALALANQAQQLAAEDKANRAKEKADAESLAREIAERQAYDDYIRRQEAAQDSWEAARQKERDAAWLQVERDAQAEREALYNAAFEQEEAAAAAAAARLIALDKTMRAELLAQQKEMEARAIEETKAYFAEQEALAHAYQDELKVIDNEQADSLRIALDEQKAEQKAVLAQMAAEQLAYEEKIKESYKRLKLAASEQYKGVGPAISAGSQIQATHGTDAAKMAMGSDSYLLTQTANLQKYRKALDDSGKAATAAGAASLSMAQLMEESHSAVRGLTGALGALWLTWGSVIPMVAGAAIGTALQQVVSVGKDVEYQLTFVSALSRSSVVDIQAFGDAVRGNLVAPKDAAEGLRTLAQSGLSVQDSLRALPDVLKLATVGEMSAADAARDAAGIMHSFGLTVGDLGHIGDVVTLAASKAGVSVQDMASALKESSAAADLYHVSIEEAAASMEVMGKKGIDGNTAATTFRKTLQDIASPSANAKKAIDLLGLSFYDATTKQLKPYSEILTEIKARTDKLNESSKIDLLNNIFGERGGKALDAVLSSFDDYKSSLDDLKTKSQDFTASVSDALSQTSEGRMKGLLSDFQLVAVSAFNEAGGAVNTFVDTLDNMVNDPAFKSGLVGLANNTAALTQFLLENGRTMAEVGVAYVAFGSIESMVTKGAVALTDAMREVSAAETATAVTAAEAAVAIEAETVAAEVGAVAAKGLSASMAVATFGISALLAVAVPLVAEWLIFSDHTDALTTSINNNAEAIRRQGESLDQELLRLQRSNAELDRRNELMAKGMSYAQAQAQAQSETRVSQNTDKETELAGNYRQAQAIATASRQKADAASGIAGGDGDEALKLAAQANADQARADDAKQALLKFYQEVDQAAQVADLKAKQALKDQWGDVDKKVQEFNAHYAQLAASSAKLKNLNLTIDDKHGQSADDLQASLTKNNATLNANLEDKHLPPKGGMAEEKAETANLIAELKRRENEITAYYTFRKQLEDAVFGDGMNNAQIQADVQARLEQSHLNDLQKQYEETSKLIELEKNKYPGEAGKAERTRLDGVLSGLQAQIEAQEKLIEQNKIISQFKADNANLKQNDAFNKTLNGLSAQDAKRNNDQQTKFDDTIKGAPSAYRQGFTATMDTYSSAISDQTTKLQEAQAQYDAILKRVQELKDLGIDITDDTNVYLDDKKKEVDLQQQNLDKLKAQGLAAAQTAGTISQTLYDRAQTAGYGWDKFWSTWSQNATSNAKIVEDTLNTTFTGMTNAFATFVTTGKLNFRSLIADIIAQAAKALASKELTSLIQLGMSLFGSAVGGGGGGDTSGTDAAGAASDSFAGIDSVGGGLAGGGQTTANSLHPVNEKGPELYNYDGKQYLMTGSKGGKVVPMERAYQGSVAGAAMNSSSNNNVGGNQTSVNMAINVSADGSSQVQNDASGTKSKQLGMMMNNAVLQVITEQQRPGGILYAKGQTA